MMWDHIHACRFIYNYMLSICEERYKNGEKRLSEFAMNKLITPLKKQDEYKWLANVSNSSLQKECNHLNGAYVSFFNGKSNLPKYKSRKRDKLSYSFRNDTFRFSEDGKVNIPKLKWVKFKTDYDLPIGDKHKFSNPVISNVNNKWILTFSMEVENQNLELTNESMGIDLGIKEAATVAFNGDKIVFHNINKSRKIRQLNKNIRNIQRRISRKYEANKVGNKFVKTKNIEKCESKLRKLYARTSNIRSNYIHQSTHSLIMMRPCRIVIEDLDVMKMMKNKSLATSIGEQCFSEWRRQLEYKCCLYGIELVIADKYYPSSKTCHCCGTIKRNLKLSERTFVCPDCGYTIDRDYNAALNLSTYSL